MTWARSVAHDLDIFSFWRFGSLREGAHRQCPGAPNSAKILDESRCAPCQFLLHVFATMPWKAGGVVGAGPCCRPMGRAMSVEGTPSDIASRIQLPISRLHRCPLFCGGGGLVFMRTETGSCPTRTSTFAPPHLLADQSAPASFFRCSHPPGRVFRSWLHGAPRGGPARHYKPPDARIMHYVQVRP